MSMNSLVSLDDALVEALDRAVDSSKTLIESSICPIFRIQNGRLEHEGTCSFLRIDDFDYLVTAAHVVDILNGHRLALPSGPLIPLTLPMARSIAPNGNRSTDKLDFAYSRLSPAWRDFGIAPLEFRETPEQDGAKIYCAVGFPNTQMTIDPKNLNIRPVGVLSFMRRIDEINGLAVHPNFHLVLQRNRKYALQNGKKTKQFSPIGMSGGLVFEVEGATNLDVLAGNKSPVLRPKALMTELVANGNAILATRLSYVAATIIRNGWLDSGPVEPP
jgi:hypothetical protein